MKKIDNPRKFVDKLLKDVFMGKNGDIISVKPIHRGYTNESYVVTFANNKRYQVRIPHCGKLINRASEYQIISLINDQNFIYFDVKTGIAVKEWIEGKNPRIPTWRKWKGIDQLFTLIKKIHQTQLPPKHKLKKLDFDVYNKNLFRLRLSYQAKYLSIVENYKDDVCVPSHTDINYLNMIVSPNGKIRLIDYEWCALAPDYWDYANFIREARIRYNYIDWKKYIPNFDVNKLKDYIFACSVYAFLWTWEMPQTPRIKKYRARTIRQIKYYGRGIINNGK